MKLDPTSLQRLENAALKAIEVSNSLEQMIKSSPQPMTFAYEDLPEGSMGGYPMVVLTGQDLLALTLEVNEHRLLMTRLAQFEKMASNHNVPKSKPVELDAEDKIVMEQVANSPNGIYPSKIKIPGFAVKEVKEKCSSVAARGLVDIGADLKMYPKGAAK